MIHRHFALIKKHHNYLWLFLLLPLLWGCEQEIENPELPYEEHLVVTGFLYNDSNTVAIMVSRTLPLTEKFTIEKAVIKNATVTITTLDGDIALHYDSVLYKYIASDIKPQVGKNYSLRVEWQGKVATATTALPQPPEVLAAYYTQELDNGGRENEYKIILSYKVRNQPSTCYGVVDWLYYDKRDTSSWSFFDRWSYSNNVNMEQVNKDTVTLRRTIMGINTNLKGINYARIFALDVAYYHFQNSKYGNDNDGIFGSAGTNPTFNIHGNGIGYFIGCTRAKEITRIEVK